MNQQSNQDRSEFNRTIPEGKINQPSCSSDTLQNDCNTGVVDAPPTLFDYEQILGLPRFDINSTLTTTCVKEEKNKPVKSEQWSSEGQEIPFSDPSPLSLNKTGADSSSRQGDDDWPVIITCRKVKGPRGLKREPDPDCIDLTGDDCKDGLNFYTNLTDIKPDIKTLQKLVSITGESNNPTLSTSTEDGNKYLPSLCSAPSSSQTYTPHCGNTVSMTQNVSGTSQSISPSSVDTSLSIPLPVNTFMSDAEFFQDNSVSQPEVMTINKAALTKGGYSYQEKNISSTCTFDQGLSSLLSTTCQPYHSPSVLSSSTPSIPISTAMDLGTAYDYIPPHVSSASDIRQAAQLPTLNCMNSQLMDCPLSTMTTPAFNQRQLNETRLSNFNVPLPQALTQSCSSSEAGLKAALPTAWTSTSTFPLSTTSTPAFSQSELTETWQSIVDDLFPLSYTPSCSSSEAALKTVIFTAGPPVSTSTERKSDSNAKSISVVVGRRTSQDTESSSTLSSNVDAQLFPNLSNLPVAQSPSKRVNINVTRVEDHSLVAPVNTIPPAQEIAQTNNSQWISNNNVTLLNRSSTSETFDIVTDSGNTLPAYDSSNTSTPVTTELLTCLSNANDNPEGKADILNINNSLPTDAISNTKVFGTDQVTHISNAAVCSDNGFSTHISNGNYSLSASISNCTSPATYTLPPNTSEVTENISDNSSKQDSSKTENDLSFNNRHIKSVLNRYATSRPSVSCNNLNDITSDLNDMLVMINRNHTASSATAHSLDSITSLDATSISSHITHRGDLLSVKQELISPEHTATENKPRVDLLSDSMANATSSSTLLQSNDRLSGPSGEGSSKTSEGDQNPKSSNIPKKDILSCPKDSGVFQASSLKRSFDYADGTDQIHHTTPKQGKMESMAYREPAAWSTSPEESKVFQGGSSSSSKSDIFNLPGTGESEMNMLLVCEHCDIMQAFGNCAQCESAHVVCSSCLKEEIINVMDSEDKLYLSCPMKSCTEVINIDSLASLLDPLVVELLRKNLMKKERKISARTIDKMAVSCPSCSFVGYQEEGNLYFLCGGRNCSVECCRYCKAAWRDRDGHEGCMVLSFVGTECLRDITKAPASWETQWINNASDDAFTTNEISLNSKIGMAVAAFFYKTSKDMAVKKLWRIQNRKLWEKYILKRTHLEDELGTANIREKSLFHGTRQNVQNICKEGFDTRVPTVNGAVLGKGIYFSLFASFSKRYSNNVLFVTRVLCGWSTPGKQGLLRPPYHSTGRMFDSCVDNIQSPSMYVIFDNCQCYPEYLIEYECTQLGR